MVTISTKEIKDFKAASSFIKSNKLLPILDYLKFGDGVITKTNLSSFISYKTKFDGSFLVQEDILLNFVSLTSSPTIDISISKGVVTISDGNSTVTSPSEDIANYPSVPVPNKENCFFGEDILMAIGLSSNFTDQEELPTVRGHVFISGNYVMASNGFIGYREKVSESLPNIVLSKEIALTLGKIPASAFNENDNNVFFSNERYTVGFVKPELKFFDISSVFNKKTEGGDSFVIHKDDLISFCELCIISTKSKFHECYMKNGKKGLLLEMNDVDFNVNVKKEISFNGTLEQDFIFNPSFMLKCIKSLCDQELTFTRNGNMYLITDSSSSVSLIMGINY